MEEAQLVAKVFPGAALVPGEPVEEVTVVLGSDFNPAAVPPAEQLPSAPAALAAPVASPQPDPAAQYVGAAPSDVPC